MRKNNTGREWELIISRHLKAKGMKILSVNYVVCGGEIDIVAQDGDFICFIEVKYRNANAVDPYSSVGYKKQQRIIKAAKKYLYETGCQLQPRFDVVFVFGEGEDCDYEYYKNAYSG